VTEAVDPTSLKTFQSAKLDWASVRRKDHGAWLDLYRTLLDLRSHEIVPRLKGLGGFASSHRVLGDNSVLVDWVLGDGSRLRLYLNLCSEVQERVPPIVGRRLWLQGFAEETRLGAWTVLWTINVTEK
jgi:maltooligosyltrehalose trehalohydrolase